MKMSMPTLFSENTSLSLQLKIFIGLPSPSTTAATNSYRVGAGLAPALDVLALCTSIDPILKFFHLTPDS
jgi:hypothetical protein